MKATTASKAGARVALATAILLTPAVAWSFAVTTVHQKTKVIKRWKKTNITYYLHPAGSADLTAKASLDAVRAAFKDWQDVPCGALKFQEGYHCNTALGKCLFNAGAKCSKDADCKAALNTSLLPVTGQYNKRNEFAWVETSKWKHGKYVLGVTVAITNYAGQIVESDIAMNGYLNKWTNDPYKATQQGGVQHVKSVAIHEIGHFFGAMHMLGGWKNSDPPTMAPNVMPNGMSASLNADDKKTICYLNPAGGSYKCSNDADCPYINHKSKNAGKEFYSAKLKCSGGNCIWGAPPAGGQTPLGGTCSSDNDCMKNQGLSCIPLTSSMSLCSKPCYVNSTTCGPGFYCQGAKQGGNQGYCLPDAAKWDGKPLPAGESCLFGYMCSSQACHQQVCRTTCSPNNPGKKCDLDKETCDKLSGQTIGVCMPKPGTGGTGGPVLKGAGDECYAPEECTSNICMKDNLQATVGKCRAPCTGPGTCGDGFKCVDQGEGYQGCLPGQEVYPTGAPCKLGKECSSGECIVAGSNQFCTQKCDLAKPQTCPCGMECHDKGTGARCYHGKPVACLEAGDPCGTSAECKSSMCILGSCLAGCDVVEGPIGCPASQAGCLRLETGKKKGRCFEPGKAPVGEVCKEDTDCATLLCAADPDADGGLRCIRPCDPAKQACGGNLSCHKVTDQVGVCAKKALGGSSSGGSSSGGSSSGGSSSGATDAGAGIDAGGGGSSGGIVGVPPATGGSSSGCSSGTHGGSDAGGRDAVLALAALLGLVALRRRREPA